jgi:predicted solute-binding protein
MDIASNYSIEIDENENEDEQKQQVIDYLNENTVVLGETDCEIVYQIF